MRNIRILSATIVFLLATAGMIAQETSGVTLGLTVTNGKGRSQYLELGVKQGASSGIDPQLGESELPPLPPSQIFDVRFLDTPGKSQLGNGSLNDYRAIQSVTAPFTTSFTVGYQGGEGVTSVAFAWPTPYPGRISKVVIDGTDMSGKTTYTTQFGQGQSTIDITFNFLPLSFQVSPASLSFLAGDRDPLPAKTLTITPQGDLNGSWQIVPADAWLSASPTSGNGATDVTVSINTNQIPAGTYTSTLLVRSPQEPASADVPVTLTFTVATDELPAPNGMKLAGNYPNPFTPVTMISVDLGHQIDEASAPALKVFDATGRLVADLSSKVERRSGMQSIRFDGNNLAAGIYRCTLSFGGYEQTRTMTLVK
jgi:hypothetical protein